MTRRRRRRRGGSKAEESDETLSRRSRKQQYIDEITDVEGSTRLEAKKQRRRAVSAAARTSSWSRISWRAASMSSV